MSLNATHADLPSPLDSIEYGEPIPALPAGVPELLKALTSADIGLQELNEQISRFPSIGSRLIFLANSAWAAPVVPIASLEVACSKLGLTLIRSVCLAMSIASPFNPVRCSGFDSQRYWLSALLVADMARKLGDLSPALGKDEIPVLQTVGLLHNIGLLWLADRFPILTSAALKDSREDERQIPSLSAAMQHNCRVGYAEVSGHLAGAWGLPAALANALRYHNDVAYRGEDEALIHTLGLATKLADILMYASPDEAGDLAQAGLIQVDRDSLVELLRSQQSRIDDLQELVNSYLAGE
ncbi:HDOD domain-containing protein [Granulosicoccaceae sp. 1_MG-2023]|nr:HDOD domain-containing protein [Granulosicoccaceae sp. 1_MG-2023]